ncbi:hypothetical protein [Aquibacillus saliphilus]|uniref:hypothetical protein n=1 Tax=Aquibacillus saliphilus TaxID=1909422 RepID=UPI001CF026CE|nr:hypothetical protein [Aquibacillus saliphilus]
MDLYNADYYDLEDEMTGTNVAGLIKLYKREDRKFSDKCLEMVDNLSKLNEEGKKSFEKECEFLNGGRVKIALKLADLLTK